MCLVSIQMVSHRTSQGYKLVWHDLVHFPIERPVVVKVLFAVKLVRLEKVLGHRSLKPCQTFLKS